MTLELTNGSFSYTLYDVLEVEPDAPIQKIRALYRLKSRAAHPDRRGGDVQLQQQLNRAYAVLRDPKKRKEYNEQLGLPLKPRPLKTGPSSYHEIQLGKEQANKPVSYSFKRWEPCNQCWGQGCSHCQGKGQTLEKVSLTVCILAGIAQHLVEGQGLRSEPGGKRGDLILYVVWK